MRLLRDQPLFEKDPLVVGRVVEPGKFPIAEFPVKFGRLERKRVEPGRMATEGCAAPLGLRQEALPNPAAAQIGTHPEQVDEQPAGIDMADQPGADRARIAPHENPEIIVGIVAQKRRVVGAEPIIDQVTVFPGRVLLDAEAKPGWQLHRDLLGIPRMLSSGEAFVSPGGGWIATASLRSCGAPMRSRSWLPPGFPTGASRPPSRRCRASISSGGGPGRSCAGAASMCRRRAATRCTSMPMCWPASSRNAISTMASPRCTRC